MTSKEHIGKTCPYCQTPLKRYSDVVVCSKCEMPHHAECWNLNSGCTTFGCSGRPIRDDTTGPDETLVVNVAPRGSGWSRYEESDRDSSDHQAFGKIDTGCLLPIILSAVFAIWGGYIGAITGFILGVVIAVVIDNFKKK